MERAFQDALVTDYERYAAVARAAGLPDAKDEHVVAAALATRADVIVTENTRDFPAEPLRPLGIEPLTADDFLANTVALDPALAVSAIQRMRQRLQKPTKTAEDLIIDLEASGLVETVDILRPYSSLL